MEIREIEKIINEKISPYSLNEEGISIVSKLVNNFSFELLKECIDTGVNAYFRFDKEGNLTEESVDTFMKKLGGIAYNRLKTPLDKQIFSIKNRCWHKFPDWNTDKANDILIRYISALKSKGLTEELIINDLQTDVSKMCSQSSDWSDWSSGMEYWIDNIKDWPDEDSVAIKHNESIITNDVIEGFLHNSPNMQSLCKQINASYENNLYDCTAVIMRRLLENLLILTYENKELEDDIMDESGRHYLPLSDIIKNAEKNPKLHLSSNVRKDMSLFKDLGNDSAHKIRYNSTKQDIEPHIIKYRTIVRELIKKAGL